MKKHTLLIIGGLVALYFLTRKKVPVSPPPPVKAVPINPKSKPQTSPVQTNAMGFLDI